MNGREDRIIVLLPQVGAQLDVSTFEQFFGSELPWSEQSTGSMCPCGRYLFTVHRSCSSTKSSDCLHLPDSPNTCDCSDSEKSPCLECNGKRMDLGFWARDMRSGPCLLEPLLPNSRDCIIVQHSPNVNFFALYWTFTWRWRVTQTCMVRYVVIKTW